jgi:squalene-hopene/tetraprenyl-beta-curcumene cyclase
MRRNTSVAALLVAAAASVLGADWNQRLAADYLDSRQKEWFAWPRAKVPSGACVSCHTGLTYLLVRPALRRALGQTEPTPYEKGLLEAVQAQAEASEDGLQGVETVFSALLFAIRDEGNKILSAEAKQAFDRLWSSQIRDGKEHGAWKWPDFKHDPWGTPDAQFYGAALAALALGTAPAEYRAQPEIREPVNALTAYLQREHASQSLHNRLALLWASSKLPTVLPPPMRQSLIDEILRKQQADGGWTIESLGPWRPRPEAPVQAGSNSYATGYVAFVLQQAGVGSSHEGLVRALDWLKGHQDRQFGFWAADSLNKRYEPDSMQVRFMQDAATAFASLALLTK